MNRLASQKSPYLLQHADNPVDWYPWGEEAFAAARESGRPIFLSIGYATCHWCHVMAHESFEDAEVAALMNEAFINVKVDREERPDVDGVYMTVCQLATGHGGWPLTILMTPDRIPFFAGTYFSKRGRYGRPGMLELVPRIRDLWKERRDELVDAGNKLVEALRASPDDARGASFDVALLDRGYAELAERYDALQGGFGRAPKFPTPHNLLFLLRYHDRTGEPAALEMVTNTLRRMRHGGVYDQIGFGFHRYSTDARWLVPHFEKMLYDQALLAMAYTEAWQVTGDPELERTACEILDYVLRDMTDSEGGFYSAEDADSEGREGKFYLWTFEELDTLLDAEDAAFAKLVFALDRRGNFAEEATGERTGENIVHLPRPLAELAEERGTDETALRRRLETIRETMFEARSSRVRPLLDDKVLTDWNGLMIAALARAARAFGRPEYGDAAAAAAGFVARHLETPDGALLHRYRDGEAAFEGTATDYAYLAWGSIELYQTTFEPEHLARAQRAMERLIERFYDEDGGGFFLTAHDAEPLPVRQKESYDGAIPSSNAVAYSVLLLLERLTGDPAWGERAAAVEEAFASEVGRAPSAHAFWLTALDFRLGPTREIVIAGDTDDPRTHAMVNAVRAGYRPRSVVLLRPIDEAEPPIVLLAPFTGEMNPGEDGPAAWVCTDFACGLPVRDAESLAAALT